ncbi:MAG: HlyD family efflux transporter periplasmic adaptor subunit [Planctomycetes bacterium]|nr:HlyD family efflux transporter periplasmic adaptor subunit [Planctomycetota bacterium]
MPAPLSTTGASSESHTWQELEEVFAALGQLARSSVAPPEFYRTLLDQSVRALSAAGGAVWLRAAGGALQPVAQINWPRNHFAGDDDQRRAHESFLADAAAGGRVISVNPHTTGDDGGGGNPTGDMLLVAPVNLKSETGTVDHTRAIIELLLRPDASPATYRGCEQFLAAVCELAADYHAFNDLQKLRHSDDYRNQLLVLSRNAHRRLNLFETAYAVANEGRGLVGCDRLSVLVACGRGCRLLATSGVSRIERRSGAARRLARVAELVRRTDEAAFYADGQSDALPPVAEALEQHAEESHARQVAAVPLRKPANSAQTDETTATKRARSGRQHRPQFVIVAEQFDARSLDRERLVEVVEVCTTALNNAWEYDRLPFGWLMRPLGAVKQQVTSHLPRSVFVLAALATAVAALVLVPADFNVEATGTLEPVVRRDVFAPRSGLVDEVLVAHGANVKQGDPLVRMRDPALDLEIKRVDGELETAQRQLDAVRATRTNRAVREANPTDAYRLSAEERELQQRLVNLRRELELLHHERDQLVVGAPIAGRVITWDVSHRLAARPVERGEVLVTVANLDDKWQLELDVPDDRIGYVLAAQQTIQTDLPVRFRLSSDDREQHEGHIAEVCQMARVEEERGTAPAPTVLVKVALDKLELSDVARRELRPGVSARAQIACGSAPIGYVWFHDIWDAVIEWLTF